MENTTFVYVDGDSDNGVYVEVSKQLAGDKLRVRLRLCQGPTVLTALHHDVVVDKLSPAQHGCDFAPDAPERHPREHNTVSPYDSNTPEKAQAFADYYAKQAKRLASGGGELRYGSGSIGGGFPTWRGKLGEPPDEIK